MTFITKEAAKEIIYERIFEWIQDKNDYCQECDNR